ncbi:Serine/threonine-protein kinase STY17, partial [Linum grandiflorum]
FHSAITEIPFLLSQRSFFSPSFLPWRHSCRFSELGIFLLRFFVCLSMDFTEGVGESSSPPRSYGTFNSSYEVRNDVLNRLIENGYGDAASNPELFRSLLDAHFNRLPASYGFDINMDRVEDILVHQKLLEKAGDPEERPAYHVRFVESLCMASNGSSDEQHSGSVATLKREDGVGSPTHKRVRDSGVDFEACSKLEDLNLEKTSRDMEDKNQLDLLKREEPVRVHIHEVIFSTIDKPKLLSQLSSLLSDIGLNIREAHVFSTIDGYSLDVFVVDGWPVEDTEGLTEAMGKAIARSEGSWSGSSHGHLAIGKSSAQEKSEDWEIDRRLLTLEEKIASGFYGDLYRGVYLGQDVAIKILRSEHLTASQLDEFAQEVSILREVQHVNVVQFIGACTKSPHLRIVTEYMPGGNLYDYLHRNHDTLKLSQLLKFAIDVVKVADFGVARFQDQGGVMTAETGTYRWMAPEVINHQPYDQKADVFSFAIVLWELVTAKVPYETLTPLQAALGVRQGQRPELPQNLHPGLLNLMQRCWQTDPVNRPPFSEITVELERLLEEIQVQGDETVRTMAVPDSVCAAQAGEEVDCMTHKLFDGVCNLDEGLDWISQLTDDLLINIVSRLTLPEAIRTSVLSSRWMNLWKSADLVLDFDASEELRAIDKLSGAEAIKILPEKRRRYMNWVNGVVTQMEQSCSKVTKFRVSYNLTKECNSKGDIDRWLKFAISKRVESLHLDLDWGKILRQNYYVLSEKCYKKIKSPFGLLRSLSLSHVKVKGVTLEYFIANSPVLEELVLIWVHLKKLKVVGFSHPPLPLKHLEVTYCPVLESMEIDHTPHLERLTIYDGNDLKEIKVGDCPSLVDITLGDEFIRRLTFGAFSGCASQLVSLCLEEYGLSEPISDAVEHSNLERLTLHVAPADCNFGLIPLINVCPRLHTLRLFFSICDDDIRSFPSVDVVKVHRDSIKVVEVVGFRGYDIEYEFMEYVIEYFVGLEKIVIDWSTTIFFSEDPSFVRAHPLLGISCTKTRCEAEKRVLELKSRAAQTVEFLVIEPARC